MLQENFSRLDDLLARHDWLWRVPPFKQARPDWTACLPGLSGALLGLDEGQVAALSADHAALIDLIAQHVPQLAELRVLAELPVCSEAALVDYSPHLRWEIPGRKWAQIEAFARAVGDVQAPLLEWCGGKGHLGRVLSVQHGVGVSTLELDRELCEAGRVLAQRAQVAQRFIQGDVLAPAVTAHLAGRHVVALHACGDLHRSLVRQATEHAVSAMDVAPCCYHLTAQIDYQPWSQGARLNLMREDLRLAVTETVTSAPREVRLRDLEMAWKLGFDRLRRDVSGDDCYRPFKPISKPWLKLGFQGFCAVLAAREDVLLPARLDWSHYERHGWKRQREVMRLSLVRQVFRRPLEIWLVSDLASYLAQQGYQVTLGTFCPRHITPRNILLSARA